MNHDIYLQRCLQLARLGGRNAFPNPQVGAVIVHDDVIIGEGYHAQYGGPHAEVMAVRSVSDKEALKKATIYVSLEPCSYHGNTPPCTDLILKHGIPHVVIGCTDPNPQVAGSGIQRLRDQGVEVVLSEDPAPFIDLNRRFFVNHHEKRPYITVKWAESADGYIGALSKEGIPQPVSITGFQANARVHRLRANHQAIMVGRITAAIDNPSLTNRWFHGGHPIRIVLDRQGKLSPSLKLFTDHQAKTILLTEKPRTATDHLQSHLLVPWPSSIKALLSALYADFKIGSVLIEGGTNLLQQVINEECYDEVVRLEGQKKIGNGVSAPTLPKGFAFDHYEMVGQDLLSLKKRVLSLS